MIILERNLALKQFYALPKEHQTPERLQQIIDDYKPFKLMQRSLAIWVNLLYGTAWSATFILSTFKTDTAAAIELLNGPMSTVVLAVNAFYFLGGAIPRKPVQ